MAKAAVTFFENSMRGEQTQHSTEGLGVGASLLRQFRLSAGRLVERVGYSKLRDHVQTSRYGVPIGDLHDGVEIRGLCGQSTRHACWLLSATTLGGHPKTAAGKSQRHAPTFHACGHAKG